jgi:NAD(P)-dependent dehydrogenase (short-subunit alcohol dehydrogenase family)
MIVTGAGQGAGAALTTAFLDEGGSIMANSHSFMGSTLAPTDGDIGLASTAVKIAETAIGGFGSIDGVVSNAGIFFAEPFTEYTTGDFTPPRWP